jgi:hypothetical protein
MNRLQRITGMTLIALSLFAVAGSIVGIGYAWSVHDNWTEEAVDQLTTAEDGLTMAHKMTGKAKSILDQGKSHLDDIDTLVAKMEEELRTKGTVEMTILEGLEGKMNKVFAEAQEWVENIQQQTETARTTLAIFSGVSGGKDPQSKRRRAELRDAMERLSEISEFLGDLHKWMVDIRDRKNLPMNVKHLAGLLGQIDERLTPIQQDLRELNDKIDDWKTTAAALKEDVPEWMTLAAWLVTGFLVWFAVCQVSVFRHGWKLARQPSLAAAGSAAHGDVEVAQERHHHGRDREAESAAGHEERNERVRRFVHHGFADEDIGDAVEDRERASPACHEQGG